MIRERILHLGVVVVLLIILAVQCVRASKYKIESERYEENAKTTILDAQETATTIRLKDAKINALLASNKRLSWVLDSVGKVKVRSLHYIRLIERDTISVPVFYKDAGEFKLITSTYNECGVDVVFEMMEGDTTGVFNVTDRTEIAAVGTNIRRHLFGVRWLPKWGRVIETKVDVYDKCGGEILENIIIKSRRSK